MSDRYPGGIISKTPVTPTGPYQDGTAPGIWTLEQQAYWKAQGLWPIAGNLQPDPYFEYVTLLLNNNSVNGAQNNTFLDSSSNAYSITRNGNTTQGSFSPYGSLWSNYFYDGSYEYVNASSTMALGSGDWTIEVWANFTSVNSNGLIFDYRGSGDNGLYPLIYFSATGILKFVANTSSGAGITATTSVSVGTWNHIAVCKSGSSTKLFINGQQTGSTYTDSNTYVCGTYAPVLGVNGTNRSVSSYFLNGYLSNFRVVKGTALYTSTFTPPTSPLTAISGTALLLCQSNRFVDNSSNALSVTSGTQGTTTPSVQRFSPFNPTTSYSTATIGGSGYFDGSGDYLSFADNSAFTFGTGNFTIEAWVYANSFSLGYNCIFGNYGNGSNGKYVFNTTPSGYLQFYTFPAGSVNSSVAIPLNAWTHVAVTRVGNDFYLWQNGVQVGTWNDSVSLTGSSSNAQIGAYFQPSSIEPLSYWNGYISNVRVVKGTAVYTSTFTPPTAPLTAVSGTSLLTNMTNAALYDSSMLNDIETSDTSQVSTAVEKFSIGSLKTTGATSGAQVQPSSLRLPSSTNWAFSTGDFTVEFWCYGTSGMAPDSAIICSELPSRNWLIQWNSGSYFTMQTAWMDATLSSAGTAPFNTWLHCALVRTNGTLKFFINGTETYSNGFAYDMNVVSGLQVGSHKSTSSDVLYMSQVRITKGYARYTSNFSVPTSPFLTL